MRLLLRLPRAHLVEAYARRFDRVERLLLHLDRARALGRAREGAARDRPMIRALRLLQRLKRRRVLRLPLDPRAGLVVHRSPNRDGLTGASSGSTRLSSSASATSCAVTGARRMPFR